MWINELDSREVIRRRVRQSLADLPLRSRYSAGVNFSVKLLDFVKFGGPKWMVGSTIFEMWLGAL